MGRACNICRASLEEFDPHLTCKRCRQPNPSKFYCTNKECKACTAIRSYTPLECFLKDRSDGPVGEAKISSVGYPSVSTTDNHNEVNIENRLYGRILSTLLTSFKNNEEKNQSESLVNVKITEVSPSTSMHTGKDMKPSMQITPKKDPYVSSSHKLSSKVGDILTRHTLLSDPSKAEKLAHLIALKTEDDFWPPELNPDFILKVCPLELPISMKFHPKARQFQSIIFGEFNPKLPNDIMSEDYCLKPPTKELKLQFLHSRQKLQTLLFTYSLHETFATDFNDSCHGISDNLTSLIDQIEALIIREANCFCLIIQNIRHFMLSGAICKLDGAIDKLIFGPAHPSQFFGPFVNTIHRVVQDLGSDYCIMEKLKPVLKLKRLPETHPAFNFKNWEKIVSESIELNKIKDEDKLALALYTLPKGIKSLLYNGGKKIKKRDYEYLIDVLQRNLCTKEDLLKKKQFYARVQSSSETVKSFADDLKKLVPIELSPQQQENMLRDQFLRGIYDVLMQEKLCRQLCLTFTECVNFAVQRHQTVAIELKMQGEEITKVTGDKKRKRSTSSSEDQTCKQMKTGTKCPTEMLNSWMDELSLENMNSYDILCPWTGLKLRTIAI